MKIEIKLEDDVVEFFKKEAVDYSKYHNRDIKMEDVLVYIIGQQMEHLKFIRKF